MEQQIFSSIDCQERFFAIRGFLGISEPDLLWAANVQAFIDFIGPVFLYWIGGL